MFRLMSGDDVSERGDDGVDDVSGPAAERPGERARREPETDGAPTGADDAQARIESAREAARRRRRELGLPDLPPDEVAPPKRGTRSAKRTKNHGRFMRQGSR